ncbi:MAG: sulfatase-like hydrolase/transferase, partial [Spirochaetia bacterium]|nr:sulfatase-like hydrolase/transferase [Spirochaetia bacterium]
MIVSCLASPFLAAKTGSKSPNILVLFADDQGWADLGIQGVNQEIKTPQLDKLARDGALCTRGYVTAPQCQPSRAGLNAGCYQQRFGVDNNTTGPMPLEVVTLPERLKKAGYVTGMVGKWHLDLHEGERDKPKGPDPLFGPWNQGYDEYFKGELGFVANYDLNGKDYEDPQHPVSRDPNKFRVVVQTEAALAFLDRRKKNTEQPWFLYVAWFAPHAPIESPEPWFSQTPADLPLQRRQALAMIGAMDDGCEKIRNKLKEMGVEKDTLIFYISDNGAPLKEKAWNGSSNLPCVGEKGMLTDGGVREPYIVTWPGTIPAGKIYDKPVSSLDVAATAVALAGLPSDPGLDGANLIPFLAGT